MVNAGDLIGIAIFGEVNADADPVAGSATALSPSRVDCRNNNSGAVVTIILGGATSWDCEAAGLAVNVGDSISIKLRGPAD